MPPPKKKNICFLHNVIYVLQKLWIFFVKKSSFLDLKMLKWKTHKCAILIKRFNCPFSELYTWIQMDIIDRFVRFTKVPIKPLSEWQWGGYHRFSCLKVLNVTISFIVLAVFIRKSLLLNNSIENNHFLT